jgi:hypothetical protein
MTAIYQLFSQHIFAISFPSTMLLHHLSNTFPNSSTITITITVQYL